MIAPVPVKQSWRVWVKYNQFQNTTKYTGSILCMHPTNERRRYNVTSSLIGWAHIQNYRWNTTNHQLMLISWDILLLHQVLFWANGFRIKFLRISLSVSCALIALRPSLLDWYRFSSGFTNHTFLPHIISSCGKLYTFLCLSVHPSVHASQGNIIKFAEDIRHVKEN